MATGASDKDKNETKSEQSIEKTGRSDTQVVEPEQINNASIYRVYLSASNGIKKYRDTFRKMILNAGDLVIETCGEINTSKMMGRIRAADAVIIAIDDKDTYMPNHSCDKCPISSSCIKAKEKTLDSCASYVFDFEFRYAKLYQKPILFLVNQQDSFYISSDQEIVDYYNNLIVSESLQQKSIASFDQPGVVESLYRSFRTTLVGRTLGLCAKNELDSDKLLRVLNQCVQLGSVSQTIGQYTITSGEMDANAGSEIHILTNEMYNYDFTAMSSLTISINTQCGVQYYYYGTSKDEKSYKEFKQRVADYYKKSLKARNRVVAWIRQAKCDAKSFSEFLNIVSVNKTIRGIIAHLLVQCNQYDKIEDILKQCEEGCKTKKATTVETQLSFDQTKLCDWISGKIFNDESRIYRLIDNLSILIKPLKSDNEIGSKTYIKDFLTKLEALQNMALLTRWQGSPDNWTVDLTDNELEQERLINYFKYKDVTIGSSIKSNIIISDQIEKWIKPKKGEIIGVDNGEFVEQNIDNYLNNIHFCLVENNTPYVLAYNFVLFLDYNPRGIGRDAAAWYTTYVANDNPSSDAIDNYMLMVDIDAQHNLFTEIQAVFKQLIVCNVAALEELKKSNSNILQRLEIVEK